MKLNAPLVLPTPYATLFSLLEAFSNFETFYALWSTVWKGLMVLGLVIAVGVPIGFVMGLSDTVYGLMRPVIMVVQAVPVISWLVLVIFLWGIGWKGPVLISLLSLLPMVIFTTVSGVRNLDKTLVEMVTVYKVPKGKVFKEVYLGSIVPFVSAAVEVSVGDVWKVILVSEYLCGSSGIGVLISWARQYVDVPRVYALTIIAVALGIASERLVKKFLGRITKRWVTSS